MTESYVHDFADDTAFERYVLQQAVPIVARDAGSTSAVYDVAADQISWNVVLHETVGMTLDEAVDRLGIRPLCLGAAWKITDLLVEQALAASGVSPGHGQDGRSRKRSTTPKTTEVRQSRYRETVTSGRV